MAMTTGLMTSGPFTEYKGSSVDLDGYFELVKSWGLQTLDIFPGFLQAAPVNDVRAALDRHGMTCACYYIAADLNATEAAAEAKALEQFKEGIDNAMTLGSPIVFTHGTQHSYAGEDMFARYTDRLAEMLPLVNETPMTLVVENAGTLMHKVQDMLRLMDALGEAGLRLCLDTGNFYLWEQDAVDATRRAIEWTIHFHVKDYVDQSWVTPGTQPAATQVDLGTGSVDHAGCLQILRDSGYEGVLAFEPHGNDSIEAGLKALSGWLAE